MNGKLTLQNFNFLLLKCQTAETKRSGGVYKTVTHQVLHTDKQCNTQQLRGTFNIVEEQMEDSEDFNLWQFFLSIFFLFKYERTEMLTWRVDVPGTTSGGKIPQMHYRVRAEKEIDGMVLLSAHHRHYPYKQAGTFGVLLPPAYQESWGSPSAYLLEAAHSFALLLEAVNTPTVPHPLPSCTMLWDLCCAVVCSVEWSAHSQLLRNAPCNKSLQAIKARIQKGKTHTDTTPNKNRRKIQKVRREWESNRNKAATNMPCTRERACQAPIYCATYS